MDKKMSSENMATSKGGGNVISNEGESYKQSDAVCEIPTEDIAHTLGEDVENVGENSGRKKKSIKMNKKELAREKKKRNQEAMTHASKEYMAGKFSSIRACARHHNIPFLSLYYGLVVNGGQFSGSGKSTNIMTTSEEKKVADFVKWKASIGYGVNWMMLQLLLQEVLVAVTKSNPMRKTGLEDIDQLPHRSWVRRFAERHNLKLRATSEISKGRQVIKPQDITNWQKDTWEFFSNDPELLAALQDPQRVFNQDETPIQLGIGNQFLLAEKGSKLLYNVTSNTRDHITASFIVSAAGGMVPPRCVFKGVRNVALNHLKDLPKDGLSGEWGLSVSPKGFVTSDLFVTILKDMDKYLSINSIQRPVILFIDGATPHISLEMRDFCIEKKIQPWLLKPNTSHLCQPLDLSFFGSLKSGLKKLQYIWQQDPKHIGVSLSKYTVVPLLQQATEEILGNKPHIIGKGFLKAGICPWNPNAVDMTRMEPSTVFSRDVISDGRVSQDQEPNPCLSPSTSSAIGSEGQVTLATSHEDIRGTVTSDVRVPQDRELNPSLSSSTSAVIGPEGQIKLARSHEDIGDTGVFQPMNEQLGSVPMEENNMPVFNNRMLHQFEAIFLMEDQKTMFEKMFHDKKLDDKNTLFQSWLPMKLATLPSEVQALDAVIESRSPKDIPQRKKRTNRGLPVGQDRFNPTSEEWKKIMENQKKPKETNSQNTTKKKRGRPKKI